MRKVEQIRTDLGSVGPVIADQVTDAMLGRRSQHSLYDSRLANQSNLELFDSQWAKGFTSLWTLPSRLAARQQGAVRE